MTFCFTQHQSNYRPRFLLACPGVLPCGHFPSEFCILFPYSSRILLSFFKSLFYNLYAPSQVPDRAALNPYASDVSVSSLESFSICAFYLLSLRTLIVWRCCAFLRTLILILSTLVHTKKARSTPHSSNYCSSHVVSCTRRQCTKVKRRTERRGESRIKCPIKF